MLVVRIGHDGAEILLHQVRMRLHRLGDGAENDAVAFQLLAVGRGDGHAVEDRVDRDFRRAFDTGQDFLLLQRDTQFFIGFQKLRVDLVQALRAVLLFRRGVIVKVLIVDRRHVRFLPSGFRHVLPQAEGLQAPFQQPFRLFLLLGNQAHDVFVQAFRREVHLDFGGEAIAVLLRLQRAHLLDCFRRRHILPSRRRGFVRRSCLETWDHRAVRDQIRQGYAVQCRLNRRIDPVPASRHGTQILHLAIVRRPIDTGRERNRPVQGGHDLGHGDLRCRSLQGISPCAPRWAVMTLALARAFRIFATVGAGRVVRSASSGAVDRASGRRAM